jgi:hypothetical protein
MSPPSSGPKNKPSKKPAWKQVSSTKMEAIISSETSDDFQGTTRRYTLEAIILHDHSCENFKSYTAGLPLSELMFCVFLKHTEQVLVLTYLLTYLRSWALLEKPPIVQPLKNFPAFYGTRGFITVFKRALYWSLSWARSIQPTPSHPISLRSIIILSTQVLVHILKLCIFAYKDETRKNWVYMRSARVYGMLEFLQLHTE